MVIQETSEENDRILGDSEPETDCEPRETPSSARVHPFGDESRCTLSAEGDSFMPRLDGRGGGESRGVSHG